MTPNKRIANEIMGWKEVGMGYFKYSNSMIVAKFPSFDSNLNECHLMEEKIKEKGWDEKYSDSLLKVLAEPKETYEAIFAFEIAHATALQKVSAAIRMLDEMSGEK